MFQPETLNAQLDAVSSDPVRTLIIGAGVAGTSLAALQRKRGRHPVLIERASEHAPAGYMIGSLPLGGNLFHTLDRYGNYLEASCDINAYEMGDTHGRVIRRFGMSEIFAGSGDFRGIDRGSLIDELSSGGAVTFDTTVTEIEQSAVDVAVTFSDGMTATFDVVVVADGINSSTRNLVQRPSDLTTFDSKWGGWVVWAPATTHAEDTQAQDTQPPGTYSEFWGPGRFVGFYPVKNRVGVFVGGPRHDTAAGPAEFARRFRAARPLSAPLESALDALAADPDPFYWEFVDHRSARFAYGRVVLLGDAGAGFLPTAGVGANMAMDSAAALDDELSRTGRDTVAFALELYERRQRPRVIAAQTNSRMLARLMFRRSRLIAWCIRVMMRWISITAALGGIRKVIERR
ncbi:MAG: FAD-dependent monooxygenase [Cryobacterium sp.]|nr:FAD-dependent monooxygenase [Cryobacterium sp.]